jgi:hypothetical protein
VKHSNDLPLILLEQMQCSQALNIAFSNEYYLKANSNFCLHIGAVILICPAKVSCTVILDHNAGLIVYNREYKKRVNLQRKY